MTAAVSRGPLIRVAASVATAAVLAAPVAASAGSSAPPTAFKSNTALGYAAAGEWVVAGYPQRNVLPVWPENPNDASIPIGVVPYDEIAPKLNALQAASNRVSARVAGKSSRRGSGRRQPGGRGGRRLKRSAPAVRPIRIAAAVPGLAARAYRVLLEELPPLLLLPGLGRRLRRGPRASSG